VLAAAELLIAAREGAAAVALLREHETEHADALVVAQREAAAILLEAGMATQDGRDARLNP